MKKALRRYYEEGKIRSKEDFKHVAREITHKVTAKETSQKWDERTDSKVRKYVDARFEKAEVVASPRLPRSDSLRSEK